MCSKPNTRICVGALLVLVFSLGCNPMTLSHEGRIDFTQYTYVYVEPVQELGNATFGGLNTGSQNYLIRELNTISGFRGAFNDPSKNATAILAVSTRVESTLDYDSGDVRYDVDANWVLRTSAGQEIARGATSSSDEDMRYAIESALYEVALYFIRPYRI